MSIWDTEIFEDDAVVEFLDEVQGLESDARAEALEDAVRIALSSSAQSEKNCGLAAAVIAAIWTGAPYSSGEMTEEYSFITEGIGDSTEALNEVAAEVFEKLVPELDESVGGFLEDFVEAVE